jgi:hypothetical protein
VLALGSAGPALPPGHSATRAGARFVGVVGAVAVGLGRVIAPLH